MGSDGEDELGLEKGNMIKPETGSPSDYEEVWIEKELSLVPADDGNQVVVFDFDQGADQKGVPE